MMPAPARAAFTRYETGTSTRARAGTRVHSSRAETARSPGKACPPVPARGRASVTRLSLVMKGSPVRVRASAYKSPAKCYVALPATTTACLRRVREPSGVRVGEAPGRGSSAGSCAPNLPRNAGTLLLTARGRGCFASSVPCSSQRSRERAGAALEAMAAGAPPEPTERSRDSNPRPPA